MPTLSITSHLRLLLASVFVCGCTAASPKQAPKPAGSGDTLPNVRVEGQITEEGIECIALRSDEGELFTLLEVPDPFDQWRRYVGMRFLVIGEESQMSHCMQGRTLRVVTMTMIDPSVR